jgi:threonine dehydrogenase-like Zn-dependent dehydrogenase
MKAIVVTDQAAGTAGMTLVERPEPQAAINDVVVEVHASGFVPTELTWPSTWTDRLDRDRTPSIPGHELAGVVTALGYGTTGLSVGQRVFGLTDWTRDGTLAEYVAVEARNLAPLPGDVEFTVGASLPISGLTAWQGLFEHGRLRAGQSVLVHGAAGAVGALVTQLAREFGAYVVGTGRAADRQTVLDFAAQEFDRAKRVAAAAEQIARSIADMDSQLLALACLVPVVAGTDPDRAQQIAQSITDPDWQARALTGLVPVVARTDPDRAEQIARSITDPGSQAQALMSLVKSSDSALDCARMLERVLALGGSWITVVTTLDPELIRSVVDDLILELRG